MLEFDFIFGLYSDGGMFNSVLQSGIDLTSTSLHRMHSEGRVKAIVVHSLMHLLAALEFIKLTLNGEKALLLLDRVSTLFIAHKVDRFAFFFINAYFPLIQKVFLLSCAEQCCYIGTRRSYWLHTKSNAIIEQFTMRHPLVD